jgi:hypothetical protein
VTRRRLVSLAALSLALLVLAAACSTGHSDRRQASTNMLDKGALRTAFNTGAPELETMEETLAREQWFYGQRTAPGTRIPAGARLAALRQARALPSVSLGQAAGSSTSAPLVVPSWTNIGPKPVVQDQNYQDDSNGGTFGAGFGIMSGRVSALAVKPSKPDVVFAGGADGGVWKSTNGGASWNPIGDGIFATQSIGAIALSPTKGVVFVGTGEANTNGDAYWGAGIYRSNDGGKTFSKVGGTTFDRVTVFKILCCQKQKVFAATNNGLYKSTDLGNSWTAVLKPGGSDPAKRLNNFISDVAILRKAHGQIFLAAVGWRGGTADNGLWRSTDGGNTFTNVTGTADSAGFAAQANIGRVSLATIRSTPGLLYAVVQDAASLTQTGLTQAYVYQSFNGVNGPWVKVADSSTFAADPDSALTPAKIGQAYYPGIQSWYNQYVVIDPVNTNHVVVGLEEVYNTTDGGVTWHTIGRYWNFCATNPGPPGCWQDPVDHPTTHPDQHAGTFAIASNGQPKLYVGNDGGVWSQQAAAGSFSNDNWSNLNATLSITQPYYAEPSAGANPVIYAGTQDNGSLKYEDGRWIEVFGGDGADVAVEPNNASHTYEEYVYLTISKSADGGHTWTAIDTPDSGDSALARFIAPFDLDPINANHVVALGQHVWESTAGINTTSSSWTQSYDNGSGRVGTALGVRGTTIYEGWCGPCNPTPNIVDPNGTGFGRGLATNVGGAWHAVSATGLPNRYITSVTIDPANLSHIFVTTSGFSRRWVAFAGAGHVFESTNGGGSFTDITANLPDIPANDTVLYNGTLIVGTDVGVFVRSNVNGSWSVLGSGLPAVSALDLSIVPGGSTLVAATHGRGIYTLPLG